MQEESVSSQYEQAKSDQSIWKILGKNPLLYLFLFCGGLWSLVYSQFNFLLPLNLEQIYAEQGAVLFGTLTSVNAVVVIVGTPLLTKWISGLQDVSRLLIGQLLVLIGFSFFVWAQNLLVFYFVAMVIFTLARLCRPSVSSLISPAGFLLPIAAGSPPFTPSLPALFSCRDSRWWDGWQTPFL